MQYGGHDKSSTGCFVGTPYKAPPPAVYREVIPVGKTSLSINEVFSLITGMGKEKYQGMKYHLLEQNCNHFSMELVQLLTNGKRPIPYISWINRAAAAAKSCSCLLPMPDELLTPPLAEKEAQAGAEGQQQDGRASGADATQQSAAAAGSTRGRDEHKKLSSPVVVTGGGSVFVPSPVVLPDDVAGAVDGEHGPPLRVVPLNPQHMQRSLPPSPSRTDNQAQGAGDHISPSLALSPKKKSKSPISLGSARSKAYRYHRDDS